ncbi:hypothetical protein OTU49_006826 [Cherax quadricarinatus]|uniref:Uncharacterized protein n=1 Tax=Cherax quadricarinatus TaxID=27406 RepID=A0AAW0WYS6_CHEQU
MSMRRNRIIQSFTQHSSSLHFKDPNVLGKPINRPQRDIQYVLDGHLTPNLHEPRMTIHVDTGANKFYVSKMCLTQKLNLKECPKRVKIQLDQNHSVISRELAINTTNDFDFVMGRYMMR